MRVSVLTVGAGELSLQGNELASLETANQGAGAHMHMQGHVWESRLWFSKRGRHLLRPRVQKSFINLNLIIRFVFY